MTAPLLAGDRIASVDTGVPLRDLLDQIPDPPPNGRRMQSYALRPRDGRSEVTVLLIVGGDAKDTIARASVLFTGGLL